MIILVISTLGVCAKEPLSGSTGEKAEPDVEQFALGPSLLEDENWWTRERKAGAMYGVAVGGVLAYGFAFWDYGDQKPNAQSEGWFGKDTDHGGADKLGHFYGTYAITKGAASLARRWGYERKDSARVGALTSFLFSTTMEIGDSFSDYGFSWEDFVANTLGSVAGYYHIRNQRFAEFIDFRVEYWPHQSPQTDIITDYNNMKFLAAFKLSGFEDLRDTPWRYVEFLGGYYTRNFDDDDKENSRTLFVGVGLNLSELLRGTKATGVFNYLQLPYTYLPLEKDL